MALTSTSPFLAIPSIQVSSLIVVPVPPPVPVMPPMPALPLFAGGLSLSSRGVLSPGPRKGDVSHQVDH
jgi:hypothetical protein